MEAEDCSLWHHLIFFEEPKSDGNNQVDCWLCKKAVVGCPGYKCSECNFHQHKSCPELQPHTKDIKIEHYLSERHHLIFVEKVDGIGNNQNVCLGCGEPVVGPAYKCSIPKCTILLHKPCSELSRVIKHTMHPDHTLILQVPSKYNRCDICRKNCSGSFFYRCFNCDFDIDIKCVSRWLISAEDCHQHTLFPMRKQMQFTCEACAKESKGIAYQCSDCRVLIHRKCALFPHTIKTLTHEHFLTRTYSLHQDEQRDNICCKLCNGKVNTEYAAYSCQKCCYNAHLTCAYRVQGSVDTYYIKHEGHPHTLLLIKSYFETCDACGEKGVSFECNFCYNFSLCIRCATLPLVAKYEYDTHSLKLSYRRRREDNFREDYCLICEEERDHLDHWFYYCEKCKFIAHPRCVLGENPCINYGRTYNDEGHKHPLIIVQKTKNSLPCDACGATFVDMALECTQCKFSVHWYCLKRLSKEKE